MKSSAFLMSVVWVFSDITKLLIIGFVRVFIFTLKFLSTQPNSLWSQQASLNIRILLQILSFFLFLPASPPCKRVPPCAPFSATTSQFVLWGWLSSHCCNLNITTSGQEPFLFYSSYQWIITM